MTALLAYSYSIQQMCGSLVLSTYLLEGLCWYLISVIRLFTTEMEVSPILDNLE